jgi:hypothetical protein
VTLLGLTLTLGFALLVLCRSRWMAAVAVILAVCYLTEGQVVNVGVFHFTAIRIVDRILVACNCAIAVISTVRVGTLEEVVYQAGSLYNIFLSYIIFRCLVRDERDLREVLRKLAPLIVPLALLVLIESLTNHNLFSVFGDIDASSMTRNGHVRSQGPFQSPIITGAFGMTFAMLYGSVLFAGERTRFAVVGLVASLLIMICAGSSGPFLGFVFGLLAFACWPLRRHTRGLRWGLFLLLVGLSLVMKAPVWFILGRASNLAGGGGYHRAYLIDQFVNHFDSWWLLGTSDTHDWFPYQLIVSGQADITNAFVSAGVSGGLVGLILFVALVVLCFQRIGMAMKSRRGNEPAAVKMFWGIGSTLTASIGVLFSITYFDQMGVIWYFLLACIGGFEIRKRQIPVQPQEEQKRPGTRQLVQGNQF